jgi:hypothetical protein
MVKLIKQLAKTIADSMSLVIFPVIIIFQIFSLVSFLSDVNWVLYQLAFTLSVIGDAILGIREAIHRNFKVSDGVGVVVSGICVISIWIDRSRIGDCVIFAIQSILISGVMVLSIAKSLHLGKVTWLTYAALVYSTSAFVFSLLDFVKSSETPVVDVFQPLLYLIYTIFDLYLNRIPWSKFVSNFAESRNDVKSELNVIFVSRTVIPLLWNLGFCIFFFIRIFERDLQWLNLIMLLIELVSFTGTLYCAIRFLKAYFVSDSSKSSSNIYAYLNEEKSLSLSKSSLFGQSMRRSQYGSLDVI